MAPVVDSHVHIFPYLDEPAGFRSQAEHRQVLQLYMAAVVFAGFAPSFYLKPARALAMSPVIHVHAAVMTLWIVFMAIQGVLPSRGRTGAT